MAATTNLFGVFRSKSTLIKETSRSFLTAFIVILIVVAGIIGWRHFHKPVSKRAPLVGVSQIESIDKNSTSSLLKSGNTKEYEESQRFLAVRYYNNKDYADAERVMNELFSNVSAEKVSSASYIVMADILKAENNKSQYKQYVELTIAKLKSEGNLAEADLYQKELNGL